MLELFVSPFVDYGFMRRALVGCLALSLGATPIGVFLVLRRMSLTGDAMAHAILPGAALGYLLSGLSLGAMTLGGLVAGCLVALMAAWVSRVTLQREDASLAAFYLISLAAGVVIISLRGNSLDLLHILFGSVLALDDQALLLLAGIAAITLLLTAVFIRYFTLFACDPGFLRSVSPYGGLAHYLFLFLAVLNLVGGFHALGTLMAVGIMILPAVAARFWFNHLGGIMLVSLLTAVTASWFGLVLSFHLNLPPGPTVILGCGAFYIFSFIFGRRDSLLQRYWPERHLEA